MSTSRPPPAVGSGPFSVGQTTPFGGPEVLSSPHQAPPTEDPLPIQKQLLLPHHPENHTAFVAGWKDTETPSKTIPEVGKEAHPQKHKR